MGSDCISSWSLFIFLLCFFFFFFFTFSSISLRVILQLRMFAGYNYLFKLFSYIFVSLQKYITRHLIPKLL